MNYKNKQLEGSLLIKDTFQRINDNSNDLTLDLSALYTEAEVLQANIDAHIASLQAHASQNITVNSTDPSINTDNVLEALEELSTRVSNIISQSGTSDTEVVDARLSSVYGAFASLKQRLDNTDVVKADETMITNSYSLDLAKAYGEVKTIEDGQDVSLWTAVGTLSQDTTNVKIGSGSIKSLENGNVARNLYVNKNNINIDFSKLNNGEESGEGDYISLVIYISDVSKMSGSIRMSFDQASTYSEINVKYIDTLVSSLVTGWNYIKIKKSLFKTLGTGVWSGIHSMRLSWNSTINAVNTYVSIQSIQLVKADPSLTYPNPLASQGWTINNGEWFVGEEFGQVVLKGLGGTENIIINALEQKNTFDDCIIEVAGKIDTQYKIFSYWVDTLNFVQCDIWVGNLMRVNVSIGGIVTQYSVSVPNSSGDFVKMELIKKGNEFLLIGYVNGNLINQIKFNAPINGGRLVHGYRNTDISTYINSASITNIAHAHHADIAEVAKGLTVKRQSGAFIPDELNYGQYGIDTANNRLYVKKSDTQVIYFTGVVV